MSKLAALLEKKGADVELKDVKHILDNDLEEVKKIDGFGYYPLHLVVWKNAPADVFAAVLKAFPEAASKPTNDGRYPLHLALQYKAPADVFAAVLKAFPEAASKANKNGDYPLHVALEYNAPADVTTAVLKAFPEAASKANNDGRYSLHLALRYKTPADVATAVLKAFPEAASKADKYGSYPLHLALRYKAPADVTTAVFNAFPEAASKPDEDGRYLHEDAAEQECSDEIMASLKHWGTPSKLSALFAGVTRAELEQIIDTNPDDPKEDLLALFATKGADIKREQVKEILDANPTDPKDALAALFKDTKSDTKLQVLAEAIIAADPDDARKIDADGFTALHHGMQNKVAINVLMPVFKAHSKAASVPDAGGQYLLHSLVDPDQPGGGAAEDEDIFLVFAAYPHAAAKKDKQGRTPLFHCVTSKNHYGDFNDNHAIIKTLLRYGCKDADFDPNDLKERFFVGDTSQGNLNDRFDELWELLEAESEDLSSYLATYNPSFIAPPAFNAAVELCKGWTPLQVAATLGTADSFFWLLKVHAENSDYDYLFGDPAQQDYAAVTAARASHDEKIKTWGQKYGRLLNIYKIDPQEEPRHVSETCVVIYALEFDEKTGKDTHVALKFMVDEEAFRREIDNRATVFSSSGAGGGADQQTSSLLIAIRDHKVLDPADVRAFPQIKLSSSQSGGDGSDSIGGAVDKPLKYLLVLDKGIADLSDVISHSNMAGKNRNEALSNGVKVAKCIQYLNEGHNVMHGDVKSRNFVELGGGRGTASIDLDAAAAIDGSSLAGQKVTSSGCLPPEQAAIVLYQRRKAKSDADAAATAAQPKERRQSQLNRTAELVELKRKRDQALSEDRDDDASQVMAEIKELKATISGSAALPNTPPPPVIASRAYDMWCFGVVIYQLCTGSSLFVMDVREEVNDDELAKIAEWSDDSRDKKKKMREIEDGKGWPKALISQLLSKDPEDRPKTWTKVIAELEATSSGNAEMLAAIEKNRAELSAEMKSIAVDAAAQLQQFANENKALHASTWTKMEEGFKAMQQLMLEINTVKFPFVFEVTDPADIAKEEAAERAEQEEADAADAQAQAAAAAASSDGSGTDASAILKAHQASKDLKKRLGRAKRFFSRTKAIYQRTKDVVGKASELKDDFSMEKLKGIATQFKKGETYKLRLLCGISFETVVEYEFTEKEYGPKMKKLAQVGSVIASCAIKVGTFANPIGKVASFFGYPMPEIPVEKLEGFKSYLDEVAGETDTQGEWAALKEQAENGMDLDAINTFGELLQTLIDAKRGDDWRGKLVQWPDPNNPGMVTFIDAKQYPKHTWNSGGDGGDGGGDGGGGGDGDDDTLCSDDGSGDAGGGRTGSGDNIAKTKQREQKSAACILL